MSTTITEAGRGGAATRPGGGRIRATSITLEREEAEAVAVFGEAPAAELWRAANEQLRQWGRDCQPNEGGADVEFLIIFEDGETYRGTFYVFHPDDPAERGFSLEQHIRDFCASFGGLQIYEGGSEIIYDQHCALAPDSTRERAAFLASYELGSEEQPTIWTAPDGEGGQFFYTKNGTTRVQEWFQPEWFFGRDGWRCRVVASLPPDARETADVPADVRKAVRKVYPQLGED